MKEIKPCFQIADHAVSFFSLLNIRLWMLSIDPEVTKLAQPIKNHANPQLQVTNRNQSISPHNRSGTETAECRKLWCILSSFHDGEPHTYVYNQHQEANQVVVLDKPTLVHLIPSITRATLSQMKVICYRESLFLWSRRISAWCGWPSRFPPWSAVCSCEGQGERGSRTCSANPNGTEGGQRELC